MYTESVLFYIYPLPFETHIIHVYFVFLNKITQYIKYYSYDLVSYPTPSAFSWQEIPNDAHGNEQGRFRLRRRIQTKYLDGLPTSWRIGCEPILWEWETSKIHANIPILLETKKQRTDLIHYPPPAEGSLTGALRPVSSFRPVRRPPEVHVQGPARTVVFAPNLQKSH